MLTAAHCIADELDTVMIGEYNRREDGGVSEEERKIETTHIHPQFNFDDKRFDQMLLVLDQPSTLPYLKNINFDAHVPQVDSGEIVTIGLGITDLASGNRPNVLQAGRSTYVPNEQCNQLKNDETDYTKLIQADHLCLEGTQNADGQCYGDSGGAQLLLGANVDEDVQVGIVSWWVS